MDSAVTEENAQGVAVPEEEGEREPRGEKGVHATPWLDTHPTGALVVSEARVSSGREVVVSVAVGGSEWYGGWYDEMRFTILPDNSRDAMIKPTDYRCLNVLPSGSSELVVVTE